MNLYNIRGILIEMSEKTFKVNTEYYERFKIPARLASEQEIKNYYGEANVAPKKQTRKKDSKQVQKENLEKLEIVTKDE